jgi:hypothetical protein
MSCDKTDTQGGNPVPYKKVSFTVYLTDPANIKILNKGESLIINNQGNKGIIIYHDAVDDYWAFDRTCPYHINSPCGVIIPFGNKYVCGSVSGSSFYPCCASTYNPDGGEVIQGPSTFGLKKYTVGISGNEMYITN